MRIFFILSLTLCTIHLGTFASQSSTEAFKAKLQADLETLRKKQSDRLKASQEASEKRFNESISRIKASSNEATQKMERDLATLEQISIQAEKDSAQRIAQMQAEAEQKKKELLEIMKQKEEFLAKASKK